MQEAYYIQDATTKMYLSLGAMVDEWIVDLDYAKKFESEDEAKKQFESIYKDIDTYKYLYIEIKKIWIGDKR